MEYAKLKIFFEKYPEYMASTDECIDRVLNEPDVALICELTTLKEVQTQHCTNNLIILNDRFFPGYLGITFQKNSTFSKILSEE